MAERRRDAQRERFTSTGQGDLRNAAVDPVRVSAEVAGLADRLPRGLRLGTSSWSFPGWAGIVYGGPGTGQHLARSGLAAYARHPLLRSVGIDRSFHGPIGLAEYAAYAAALVAAGAVHCLNVHPAMPGVSAQRALANGSKEPTWVVRWMLHPGFDYESARKRYAPFDRLVDEDPTTRSSLARICLEGSQSSKEVYVIINNKAEGSAPLSAFALAAAIVTAAKT